jgi:hypothetical protein
MPVLFEIEIKGTEELRREFKRIEKDLTGKRLHEAWVNATELLSGGARHYAPNDLGYLLASILEEVIQQGEDLSGVVYSDVQAADGRFYAPIQERGTGTYFPNLEALEEWAERHGTTAWRVAMAIQARGVPAVRFFEKSLQENVNGVFSLIGDSVGQIIEREY